MKLAHFSAPLDIRFTVSGTRDFCSFREPAAECRSPDDERVSSLARGPLRCRHRKATAWPCDRVVPGGPLGDEVADSRYSPFSRSLLLAH